MMWEEKIDALKKKFTPKEFHVPFTDWLDILKKIEDKFIVKESSLYSHSNWANNIKRKKFVRTVTSEGLQNCLNALNANQSFWFVAVIGNTPTNRHYVYSGSPAAMQALSSLTPNDFFVVDKRLRWLTYFYRKECTIDVYKSGEGTSPFDKTASI